MVDRVQDDGKDVSPEVRQEVLERDNYQCQVCATMRNLHLHHWKVFRSQGRWHAPQNLVTLCFECHELVHAGEIDVVVLEWRPGHWAAFVRRRRGSEVSE